MTAPELILLGGGEHARVVADAARSAPGAWTVLGIVDPDRADRTVELLRLAHLGDDDALAARLRAAQARRAPWLVNAIGAGAARRRVATRFAGAQWATIVHASAWVSPHARLEPGAVVLAGAVVNAGATCGPHSIVNTGAIVEHDVSLGAFVHVAPGAVVGGGAAIGDGAFIGLGARVRDHVVIGADATVGMGAVVVDDVPGGATVIGMPARPRPDPGSVGGTP